MATSPRQSATAMATMTSRCSRTMGKATCPPKLDERRRKRARHSDDDLRIDGGHGADAPLPTLRFEESPALYFPNALRIEQMRTEAAACEFDR
jgi:hypothetical protein